MPSVIPIQQYNPKTRITRSVEKFTRYFLARRYTMSCKRGGEIANELRGRTGLQHTLQWDCAPLPLELTLAMSMTSRQTPRDRSFCWSTHNGGALAILTSTKVPEKEYRPALPYSTKTWTQKAAIKQAHYTCANSKSTKHSRYGSSVFKRCTGDPQWMWSLQWYLICGVFAFKAAHLRG